MNARFYWAWMAACASVALAQSPAAPVRDATVVASGRAEALDRYLSDSEFSGCALVAKDGEILLAKGYGEADREKHVPFAVDSVVSIGSITKQFTAAAILKLEMEKKLATTDPIERFFDAVPPDKRAITLHHLLTHTSGLDSDFADDYDPVGRDEYVKRALASKVHAAPGAVYSYSNAGYSLLAAIVERVSKQGYEEYLREQLLLPAGVRETGYRLVQWDARRVPVGYKNGARWGTMLEHPWADDGPYWALRGNGGIESTVEDLWKWSLALDQGTVLSTEATKKLFTPHVPEGPDEETHYGYGWVIGTTPWGTRLIEHNGGNGVFSAEFRRFVDDRVVVITFSNDSRRTAGRYASALVRLLRGEAVAPEPRRAAAAVPLGKSPHHALVREFVDVFNSQDLARVRAFRAEHMPSRPGGPSEEERDRNAQRLFADMGKIAIEGAVAEGANSLTLRVRTERGETAEFRFDFEGDAIIQGLGVELGS